MSRDGRARYRKHAEIFIVRIYVYMYSIYIAKGAGKVVFIKTSVAVHG